MKHCSILFLIFLAAWRSESGELTVSGSRFLLDGRPFEYTGLSFFNAVYNTNFNASSAARGAWLDKFHSYGINVLRVWCQWDSARGFVDASPASTMYHPDGTLREKPLEVVKAILRDADAKGFCIELVLFSQESFRENIRLGEPADAKAVTGLTTELKEFRNVTFQIWNEHDDARVIPLVKLIKSLDPKRLVTNSPGYAGVLGSDEENRLLDYLTPHTSRQTQVSRHWEAGPREIESLLKKFNKPVVDDEPARNGTSQFGGPREGTQPMDHILNIYNVWRVGGYATYHHDMFQTGYGSPACPPTGVPDPEFSPYHRKVFEFLRLRDRYSPPPEARPAGPNPNPHPDPLPKGEGREKSVVPKGERREGEAQKANGREQSRVTKAEGKEKRVATDRKRTEKNLVQMREGNERRLTRRTQRPPRAEEWTEARAIRP